MTTEAVIFDEYPFSNFDTEPNMSDTTWSYGQGFAGLDKVLRGLQFYLKASAGASGPVTAKLYTHTGSFGTTGVPGSLLATSVTSIDASTLTLGQVRYTFTFSPGVQLASGTNYFLAVDYRGGTSSLFVKPAMDGSSPSHSGNSASMSSSEVWAADATKDLIYYAIEWLQRQTYSNTRQW